MLDERNAYKYTVKKLKYANLSMSIIEYRYRYKCIINYTFPVD